MREVTIEGDRRYYYTKDKLTRLVCGEYDLKITSETIQAKGYRKWIAVTYMTTNVNRIDCAEWVIDLIRRGVLQKES
jgi:hypothetical protein